jgi:hypothetical protein
VRQQSAYAIELVVLLCRLGGSIGLERHSHSLTLLRPTPDAGASRFGATPIELLSPLVRSLSLYVSSGILPMSPLDAQVFVVSFSGNEQVSRHFPSLPAIRNLRSGGGEGWRSLICCLWYPFDGSTSPIYIDFPLPWCRLDMLLSLLCTCHPSFCHCKNYCVVSLLFWVLVFCCAKD